GWRNDGGAVDASGAGTGGAGTVPPPGRAPGRGMDRRAGRGVGPAVGGTGGGGCAAGRPAERARRAGRGGRAGGARGAEPPAVGPLPVAADRLRAALAGAAAERLGLEVAEVDLRVTELLDGFDGGPPDEAGVGPDTQSADGPGTRAHGSVPPLFRASPGSTPASESSESPAEPSASSPSSSSEAADGVPVQGDERRVALAVLAVAGVARLTGTPGRPVRLTVTPPGQAALSHRHVRV